jgi:hypothetical protein
MKEGQPLASCFDEVVLKALQSAYHDAERGALDGENLERIATTIKEMIGNLRDVDPQHWFQKIMQDKADEAGGGLASLTAAEEKVDFAPLKAGDLAPGWEAEGAVVCIGGRTGLDDAAAALLSALLEKLGVNSRTLSSEAISPAHIVSLDATDAKLIYLSFMSIAPSSAHVRYLVRRLRGIIPSGCSILVGYWSGNGNEAVKALKETAEADAYATTLRQAVAIITSTARPQSADKTIPKSINSSGANRAARPSRRDPTLDVIAEKSD